MSEYKVGREITVGQTVICVEEMLNETLLYAAVILLDAIAMVSAAPS